MLPSIPGFGLSGPTRETGWEFRRVAAAFAELMSRLGYERYGAQGGDWGAAISRELGRIRSRPRHRRTPEPAPEPSAAAEPTADELAALSPAERERTLGLVAAQPRSGAGNARDTPTSRRPGRRRSRTR